MRSASAHRGHLLGLCPCGYQSWFGLHFVPNPARYDLCPGGRREDTTHWTKGQQTVQYLVGQNRLESFEAKDLAALAEALIARAVLRVETTAAAALAGGDVDGAYVAAYDAYRMTAEALLARQALRATGGDGSHMAVEDAVSAQFREEIPAFAKPTFERFRRARHSAQYFDPSAAPLTASDATWGNSDGERSPDWSEATAGSFAA
jgi:hypothetical protein